MHSNPEIFMYQREGGREREREEWPKLQRDDDEAEEERKTGL